MRVLIVGCGYVGVPLGAELCPVWATKFSGCAEMLLRKVN